MRTALAALALCALLILQTAPATRAQSTTSTSPEMTMDGNSTAAAGNSTEAAGTTTEASATDAAGEEAAAGAVAAAGEEAGAGTDEAAAAEEVAAAGEQGSTAGGTTAAADDTATTGEGAGAEGESSAAAGGEGTTSGGTSEGVTAATAGGTTATAEGNSTVTEADGSSATAEGATTPAGETPAAGGEDSSSSAGGTTSAGGGTAATGTATSSSGAGTSNGEGTAATSSSGGSSSNSEGTTASSSSGSSEGQATGGSGGGSSNGQGTGATAGSSSGSESTGTTAAGGGGSSGSGGTVTTAVPEATTQANKVVAENADVKVRVRLSFRDQQFSAELNDSSTEEATTKGAELATKVKDALAPQLALTGVTLKEVVTLSMWSGSVVADMDTAVRLPTGQLASLQEMVTDAVTNVTADGAVGTEPINSDVTQVSVIECTNTPPEPQANMVRTWSDSVVLGSEAVYTCFDDYELKTSSGATLPQLVSACALSGTIYVFPNLGTGNSCVRKPTTAPPTTTTRATTPTTTPSTTSGRPTVPTRKYVPSDIGTYDNKYFFSVTLPAMGGILVALVILLCCVRIDSPLCKVCAEGKV